MISRVLLIVISLALAAACGGKGSPPQPRDISDVVITLERTPCFGSCPIYKVTITGDGNVAYQGAGNVAVTGKRMSTIPIDKVRELVDAFDEADYFSLEDTYACLVTDLPSADTSISIEGRFKQIHDYGPGFKSEFDPDCAAPDKLVQLEEKIDQTANTEMWIGQHP